MSTNPKFLSRKPASRARDSDTAATAETSAGERPAKAKIAEPTMRQASLPAYFEQVFLTSPLERINVIKRGVPAEHVTELAERMDIPKESLIDTLRLSRATVNRKARAKRPLSQDESERVLGVEYLIGQVENMVRESGSPEGFDAAKWVSNWLNSPLPALDNQPPADHMDTVEGQKLVSSLLAMAQSGAYA